MSNWFWLALGPFLFAFAYGFIAAAAREAPELWAAWVGKEWASDVNKAATDKGLPPATHMKRRWLRTTELWCVQDGEWLWKAQRRG